MYLCGLLVVLAVHATRASEHWSYSGDTGPKKWVGLHYDLCGGKEQSPVDVDPATTEYSADLVPFTFEGYDGDIGLDIKNNGHTVQVNINPPGALKVSGGDLGATYILEQFHFHWGSEDAKGSEHTVKGEHAPLEMHLVHYRSDLGSVANSVDDPTGLAVLGVFFTISPMDNPKLENLIKYVRQVKDTGDTDTLDPMAVGDLLPSDVTWFLRYYGSLTTPTCNEAVVWTLFAHTVSISEEQLEAFRSLLNDEGEELVDNYRPTQPLNGRVVTTSFPQGPA